MTKQGKKLVWRVAIYIAIILITWFYLILCKRGLGIPCFYKQYFNIQCISCGATRALSSLLELDLRSAINLNPIFALFIYPVIGIVILQDLIICIINVCSKKTMQSVISYVWCSMQNKDRENFEK